MKGCVSFTLDPSTLVSAGAQLISYEEAMGVTHIKSPIVTALDGSLPTGRYVAAINTRQQVGCPVLPLFDRAFKPVGGERPDLFPNMPLNTAGDRRTSPWIDAWTLRASGFLGQLNRRCGTRRAVAWNEGSGLSRGLAAGSNPEAGGLKANALSTAVAGALWYQAAKRCKAVGITQVYPGFANVAASTGIDSVNPYTTGYLSDVYAGLAALGVHAPYPWAGLAITALGWFTTARFAQEIAAIRKVMTAHGDTGEIIVAEWGSTCHDLIDHPDRPEETYQAITAQCPESYFFTAPGRIPYLGDPTQYGDYGAYQWRVQDGMFHSGPDYAWGPTIRQIFSSSPSSVDLL